MDVSCGRYTQPRQRNHDGDVGAMAKRTTPEQEVQHKSLASGQLTQALLSLWATEKLCEACAANRDVMSALIRDAIVLYSGAFKDRGVGDGPALRLSPASYVPKQYQQLHDDLIAYSDRLFGRVGSEFRDLRGVADEKNPSRQGDARGSLDFLDELSRIKALILEIVCEKMWPEILNEHQELTSASDV